LRSFASPLVDRVAPMPYCQVQTLLDASTVRGRRNYVMLDPARMPAHVLKLRRYLRTEHDFDYFL